MPRASAMRNERPVRCSRSEGVVGHLCDVNTRSKATLATTIVRVERKFLETAAQRRRVIPVGQRLGADDVVNALNRLVKSTTPRHSPPRAPRKPMNCQRFATRAPSARHMISAHRPVACAPNVGWPCLVVTEIASGRCCMVCGSPGARQRMASGGSGLHNRSLRGFRTTRYGETSSRIASTARSCTALEARCRF